MDLSPRAITDRVFRTIRGGTTQDNAANHRALLTGSYAVRRDNTAAMLLNHTFGWQGGHTNG